MRFNTEVFLHAKTNGKFKIPRNKVANKSYHEEYGKLLAKERIWEHKASQFGRLTGQDRFSSIVKLPSREGYTDLNRHNIIERAIKAFDQNELVRPIVNTIAAAVFSKGSPDVVGNRQDLVDFAESIIDFNGLSFIEMAREAELTGDCFLWFKANQDQTEIRSLDALSVESILDNGNIRNLKGYQLGRGAEKPVVLPVSEVQHIKLNSTTTSQYGKSSLRHVFYWLDVLDSLFEKNWLRGAQYYGNPLTAITGVPAAFQDTIKTQIEAQIQRAGKVWVLPPDTDVKTPDFSLSFPIGEIVGWVFRMISIATEIPITLLGSADAASRGSAFFATPRFELAIHPRREIWRHGLRQFFIKIFKANGMMQDTEVLGCDDFDFNFLPIFSRDFENIADVVGIYRDRDLISKQSAQELIGLDASDEEERLAQEREQVLADMKARAEIQSQNQPVNKPSPNPVASLK